MVELEEIMQLQFLVSTGMAK